MMKKTLFSALMLALSVGAMPTAAQTVPDFTAWPELINPFPSTGGGGVMIDGYKPVVAEGLCRTPFLVRMPDGAQFSNKVEFDAVAVQGGIHCINGRWSADDGSAKGTTPFEMFIRDGVVRRKP